VRWAEVVAHAVRWSGFAWLVRYTIAQRRASILVYHDPAPETFEDHLRYLSRRHNFITLDQLVSAIADKAWERLPPRALAITIDDGHRGNAQLAAILKRYGASATIFACSQIVGTDRHYWFLEITDPQPLKAKPNAERLDQLERATGFSNTREYPQARQALSLEEIGEMDGAIELGSHTRTHPVLTSCSDAESEEEIVRSKTELESLVGRPIRHFCYPNGSYGPRELSYAERAGYRSARSNDIGWNGPNTDRFRLRVLGTGDESSVTRLAADMSGVTSYLARVRRGRLDGRTPGVRRR
jgi:peptidoglycan/xylan/chitin deacetylase (PgdA/CDA1 family)